MQHDANMDLIDSFTNKEILELWFTPINGCTGKKCDNEAAVEIMEKTQELAQIILERLPAQRIEKARALFKLQETVMWCCACLRRAHATANILQKKRTEREFAEQGIDINKEIAKQRKKRKRFPDKDDK